KQIEGKDSAVRRLMLYLGRNSFVIYLLSQPLGAFIGIVMLKVLSVDPLTIFLIMTVSSVLSAVIPVIAVKLIGSFGPGQRVLELMNLKLS
ncbi:MAG: hypothetical protein Q4E57_11150, partial [Eubacteriales bacterium]|nr:hypothetical protein [Eubacteriales bacterium]